MTNNTKIPACTKYRPGLISQNQSRRRSGIFCRILATLPIAFKLLVRRRNQLGSGLAGLPALNFLGRAASVACGFPTLAPAWIFVGDLAAGWVHEIGLAEAVGINAQIDCGDGCIAQRCWTKRLLALRANATQEVLPQGAGVLARLSRVEQLATVALVGAGGAGAAPATFWGATRKPSPGDPPKVIVPVWPRITSPSWTSLAMVAEMIT